MTILNTVQKFPLANTYVAPENVRADTAHDADALKLLAGSIRHFGRLLEPLKGYIDDKGQVAIWDGGRRYAALHLIAADADGVGRVITDAIDVYVTTQEEAAAASLATFVREDMHPADQFLAYNAKFDEGMSPDQIAAAFAVESKTVSQLLRFRGLHPEVLQRFRDGQFGLDVAFAFTLTTDQEKQRKALQPYPLGAVAPTARGIRASLTQGAVQAHDKWAQFIGRDAYAEAGGTFLSDLFSDREADEQWSNGDLVRELAQRKLREVETELEAEGWGKVVVSHDSHGWASGHARMKAEGAAVKKGQPRPFSADQMASGIAFIVCGYNGVEVERGWQKLGKQADANAPVPPSKADPARYGWSHKGHHVMTTVATEATRVALASNADAGFDAAVGQIAWAVLRKPRHGCAGSVLASSILPQFGRRNGPDVTIEGRATYDQALLHWDAQLPADLIPFMDAVAELSTDEAKELLGLCFAATLDADQPKIDDYEARGRWEHLGWVARHAKVDFGTAWTPDREFVSGGSNDALNAVIKKVGHTSLPADCKKAHRVDVVCDAARDLGWRPVLLTDLLVPPPAADEA